MFGKLVKRIERCFSIDIKFNFFYFVVRNKLLVGIENFLLDYGLDFKGLCLLDIYVDCFFL